MKKNKTWRINKENQKCLDRMTKESEFLLKILPL